MEEKKFYKSKKFWATVTGCLVAICGNYLGIDESTVKTVVGVIASFVVGQGIADVGKALPK